MPNDTNSTTENNQNANTAVNISSPSTFPVQEAPVAGESNDVAQIKKKEGKGKTDKSQKTEEDENSSVTTGGGSSGRSVKPIFFSIFALLIVVGGIFGGVTLVQREQDINSKAQTQTCFDSIDCVIIDNPGDSGSYTVDRAILDVYLTGEQVRAFDPTVKEDGCYRVVAEGDNLKWDKIGPDDVCDDLLNIQVWMTGEQVTGEGVNAQCTNIKFYDFEGNPLTQEDVSKMTNGDTLRIAVTGTYDNGSIDQARFLINGVQTSIVTTKDPDTGEFYYDYTIPENVDSLDIGAQLHHTTAGWF